MPTGLVTGSHGFVGNVLRSELRERGWNVVGIGRRPQTAPAGETYLQVDVTDPQAVRVLLDEVHPDVVFHLAATTGDRLAEPEALLRSTLAGSAAICDAMADRGMHGRLVLAGSSAEYGTGPPAGQPVTEAMPCQPVTAYGSAKLAAERLALSYAAQGTVDVVAVRAFNHVGPREPATTVAGSLARRVLDLAQGRTSRLSVADRAAVRDFTDVRDIASGYVMLAEGGISGGTYNMCSGRGRSVGEVLDLLLAAAGLDAGVVDDLPPTPGSIRSQVGVPDRIRQDTGWVANIGLEQSLNDLWASLAGPVDVT